MAIQEKNREKGHFASNDIELMVPKLSDWFINSFIYSVSKYLLGTYSMPGSVLGFGDGLKNKTDKNFLLSGSSTLAGVTDNKQTSI